MEVGEYEEVHIVTKPWMWRLVYAPADGSDPYIEREKDGKRWPLYDVLDSVTTHADLRVEVESLRAEVESLRAQSDLLLDGLGRLSSQVARLERGAGR